MIKGHRFYGMREPGDENDHCTCPVDAANCPRHGHGVRLVLDNRASELDPRNMPNLDACTCRRYAIDPECPRHGRPGQLTLDEPPEPGDEPYDPATGEIPY